MIVVTMNRVTDGYATSPVNRILTPNQALDLIFSCDLSWRATLIEVTPTRVVTRTRVLASIDTHTYEGSVEDMALVFESCNSYMALYRGDSRAGSYLSPMQESARSLIEGTSFAKQALIDMIKPQRNIKLWVSMKIQDLVAALSLIRQEAVSADEAELLIS